MITSGWHESNEIEKSARLVFVVREATCTVYGKKLGEG